MSEPGTLEIRDLSSSILTDINLRVEAGQCLCLQGASGAGKTLLLRAVADLDPHQGEVLLNDRSCKRFSAPEWRTQVALVPSESAWWSERVGDHFATAATELLSRLGFPDTAMSWFIKRLSSGERQRLALARALVQEPRALLLDEPTANLDAENCQRVEQLVADYRQQHQAAVLWVSHDPQQARRVAGQILRLHQGRIQT